MREVLAGAAQEWAVSLIWIDMLAADDEAAAGRAAGSLLQGPIRHFHDPNQLAGRLIAESLGSPAQVAWDSYLFYESGKVWQAKPPLPADWVHQNSKWGPAHYAWGEDLRGRLEEIRERMTAN